MFDTETDLQVRTLSETLARRLNETWPDERLRDANHNLQFGQYGEFLSNVCAAHLRKDIELDATDRERVETLIRLMNMQQDIDDLRAFIAAHPDTAGGRPAKRRA
ncbi:hypothetical protein [Methylobacterium sp. A54F]